MSKKCKEKVKLLFHFFLFYTIFLFFARIKIGDVMNTKRIAFVLMTLSFIFIMSGSVSSFVIGLKQDHEETFRREQEVNDEFEVFSTNTSVFEEFREELYTEILSNIYYDTMYQEDSYDKNKLSNYEHLVDEMTKNTYNLNHLCEGIYYPTGSTNSKCGNYKLIYEQVVNYFVSDIATYNSNVKKYNDYQKEQNTLFRISEYETKKDYIDYNEDNVFDGKEE